MNTFTSSYTTVVSWSAGARTPSAMNEGVWGQERPEGKQRMEEGGGGESFRLGGHPFRTGADDCWGRPHASLPRDAWHLGRMLVSVGYDVV